MKEKNKYPEDSPIPNWPKILKKRHFSIYCTPVSQAIIDWLSKNSRSKDIKTRVKSKILYEKYLSSERSKINDDEMKFIQKIYNEQVDLILMLSWY